MEKKIGYKKIDVFAFVVPAVKLYISSSIFTITNQHHTLIYYRSCYFPNTTLSTMSFNFLNTQLRACNTYTHKLKHKCIYPHKHKHIYINTITQKMKHMFYRHTQRHYRVHIHIYANTSTHTYISIYTHSHTKVTRHSYSSQP